MVDMDASGRVSAEVYGNGLMNDYTYNLATGQLLSIQSGLLSVNPLRHLEYEYDDYHNISLRHDRVNDIQETYTYDRLDRLIRTDVNSHLYAQSSQLNQTQTLDYDALGNITYKSDIGRYRYDSAKPHAVSRAGDKHYRYDKNGNMISGDGRRYRWNSNNKATKITRNGQSAEFYYGADRARYKKVNHNGDTSVYIGKLYERLKTSKTTDQKHYIYASGVLVAEHIVSTSAGTQTRYLHKDALGSIDMVSDAYANVVDRRSYDAWGKLRALPWKYQETVNNSLHLTQLAYTNKGFTGHEQIVEVDLIHMNGRIYDPSLGRFISADPHIQAGNMSQSYSRYSYVMNNPLKYNDPSGFFFKKLFKAIKSVVSSVVNVVKNVFKAIAKIPILNTIVQAAACTFGGAIGCAAYAGLSSYAVTGSLAAGLQSALLAGFTIGASGAIARSGLGLAGKAIAHGVVGGFSNVVRGGKFGVGFASSFFTKLVSPTIQGASQNSPVLGAVTAALVGGTASVIGGGKFANGAQTALAQYLFNQASQEGRLQRAANKVGETASRFGRWATAGHFENRAARNGNLPSYAQASEEGSQWKLLTAAQSIYHDNGQGQPELKFIHFDGREAVYDGDTLQLVTDPRYVGTYNYVNTMSMPAPTGEVFYDTVSAGMFMAANAGHFVMDVIPYYIGGNVRGQH